MTHKEIAKKLLKIVSKLGEELEGLGEAIEQGGAVEKALGAYKKSKTFSCASAFNDSIEIHTYVDCWKGVRFSMKMGHGSLETLKNGAKSVCFVFKEDDLDRFYLLMKKEFKNGKRSL